MKKELPSLADRNSSNTLFKAIAVFVALVLWISTLWSKKDTIMTREMQIEFLLQAQHKVEKVNNTKVEVKVSGPRSALKRYSHSSNVVLVNLTLEGQGRKDVEITSRLLDLPPAVRLLSVTPNRIQVDIKELR